MASIIIFGGHGKIALLAERLLSDRGDEVTAVIRNPDQASAVVAAGATPVVADVEGLDVEALAGLIAGHEAVVWSAGAGGGDAQRTRAVDQDAAIRTIDAAERAAVARYVMVSYFDASSNHGVDREHPFFPYAEAKAAADAHLRDSALEWTVLGPSALTLEEPTGRIDTTSPTSTQVSRANVARVIAQALHDASTIRRTICFNDGETIVADAIRVS